MKDDLFLEIPFPKPQNPKFSFIDLFAGIGGFRLALQELGGECLFSSEWDAAACKSYQSNFGEMPWGDITDPQVKRQIPNSFDILCAGFPCQAFSIAGRKQGFLDARGTLFFDVAEIIRDRQPKVVFLENVKGLVTHDKGQTLKTILHVLEVDLGYNVISPQLLNAKNFGLPQNRERIIIVAFHKSLAFPNTFTYPQGWKLQRCITDIKEEHGVSVKYYLSTQYLATLQRHKDRHIAKGNGFGYEILQDSSIANTLMCGGMGRERNLIYDNRLSDYTPITKIKGVVNRDGIRRMTPREWARLQGFPDEYRIVVSDACAYKQFGNTVAVPMIKEVAREILKIIH